MELKEIANALFEWAEKDENNRTVLCLTSEKTEETEESYNLSTSLTSNGKISQATEALVDAMKTNKGLASVITKAFIAYTVEHSTPAGIGVITISNGKEDKDE